MRRLVEAPHGSRVNRWKGRVYKQYTRQDYPMGNAVKLQYYEYIVYVVNIYFVWDILCLVGVYCQIISNAL